MSRSFREDLASSGRRSAIVEAAQHLDEQDVENVAGSSCRKGSSSGMQFLCDLFG